MPRRSSVLDHPHVKRIEQLILAEERSVASIAAEFGLDAKTLRRFAVRLRGTTPTAPPAPVLGPVETFRAAFGQDPTDYQVEYLTDQRPTLVLKSRQAGFTQAAAALAMTTARARPGADAVIISPSQTQSKELATRARVGLYELGEPLVQDSTSLLRLRNGSRIISLPGNQRAVRGYSPALVVADEAAWIANETYAALRPLLAASGGRLVVQSTAGNEVGWFFDLASADLGDDWLRLEVPASAVPFISPEFLARERRELSPEAFAAEYECTFGTGAAALGQLFSADQIDALVLEEAAS